MRMLLVFSWLIATPAFALEIDKQDFADVYQSAYFLGRGHAGTAVADYEDAMFYNPAGLALYERAPLTKAKFVRFRTFEENISGKSDPKGLYKRLVLASPMVEASGALRQSYGKLSSTADPRAITREVIGRNLHAGANNFSGLILRNFGFGAFAATRADALVAKDPDFGGLESAKARVDAFAGMTAAGSLPIVEDQVFVGASVRALHRGRAYAVLSPLDNPVIGKDEIDQYFGRGFGVGGDLGFMARTQGIKAGGNTYKFSLGVQLRDVGGTDISQDDGELSDLNIRQTLNLGLAVDMLAGKSFIRMLLDYRDSLAAYDIPSFQKIHAGIELWVNGNVGAQAGMIDGSLSYGAFVDFVLLRVDAGVYTEEMGSTAGARPDKRLYARAMVGF